MGSVGVKVNGVDSDLVVTNKGLRQGDPISPLLLNIVVDVLTRMLIKAASHNLIKGLCSDLIPGGVICLQYADDTILFMDKYEPKAANLKMILTCFERASGMRINYAKSELIPLGVEGEELTNFVNTFGCTVDTFQGFLYTMIN